MRKELGPINVRIAARVEGGAGRDVVGDRVARVVGGLQQQQRQTLTVVVGSRETEREIGTETPPASAVAPPSSPSPSPSPLMSPCVPHSPSPLRQTTTAVDDSKLRYRVDELRTRLARRGFHQRWWQRWPADMLGPHWVYRRRRKLLKTKRRWTPGDHMELSFARRLQRIDQRIRSITKKQEMLSYDRIAEKYLQWENHLREQLMIRKWGTSRNAQLDREKRRDCVRLACLRRRRETLVKLMA